MENGLTTTILRVKIKQAGRFLCVYTHTYTHTCICILTYKYMYVNIHEYA